MRQAVSGVYVNCMCCELGNTRSLLDHGMLFAQGNLLDFQGKGVTVPTIVTLPMDVSGL